MGNSMSGSFKTEIRLRYPSKSQNENCWAQKDKVAVHAWLSAKLGNAYGNVFKAQEKHPDQPLLDYDHSAFASIKTFIEGLLTEAEKSTANPTAIPTP